MLGCKAQANMFAVAVARCDSGVRCAGVNYTALCAGGPSLVAIPWLVPQCENCAVFPTNRGELEKGNTRKFYYRFALSRRRSRALGSHSQTV